MSDSSPVQSEAMVDLIEALNDKQQAAFESLRGGSSFAVAAQRAGVGRVTVYRWVKSDPNFRAAYNAWRQEMAESAQSRLLKLADKAVDCVERAIDNNDSATAVTVLAKMGIMRKTRRASIEPEIVQMQVQLEQEREKYRATVGMMRHLLEKAGLSPQEQIQFIRQHGTSGLPGCEGIPQLQDDEAEAYDDGDATEDDPATEAQPEQDQEDAPDEAAAADKRDVESYLINQTGDALTEPMLHRPPETQPGRADPISQAG
ncbi:MAG TPA: hypothetical protein VN541_23485 [Tepidisphaeraceae bacterium]|nr:hypothetical protein [Tepidisphaeraceae bacterium]